jgi:hypothetical protein
MLQRLHARLGNVRLLEALAELNRRGKPGRPPRWDDFLLRVVYLDVEFLKEKTGLNQRRACVKVAEFHGLTLNVVEKVYSQAGKKLSSLELHKHRQAHRVRQRRLLHTAETPKN